MRTGIQNIVKNRKNHKNWIKRIQNWYKKSIEELQSLSDMIEKSEMKISFKNYCINWLFIVSLNSIVIKFKILIKSLFKSRGIQSQDSKSKFKYILSESHDKYLWNHYKYHSVIHIVFCVTTSLSKVIKYFLWLDFQSIFLLFNIQSRIQY